MQDSDSRPGLIYRKDYRAPDWQLDKVELQFDIRDSHVDVKSRLQLRRTGAAGAALILNGRQLELCALAVDGKRLAAGDYSLDDASLRIEQLPDSCEISIHTRFDPTRNTALEGLYQAGDILCTQCEAHGFSRITYFLDRPDVLSRYRVSIEADQQRYPQLLSNGNRLESTELANGRHRVLWEDPFPKPCYLFALVAGDLDCVRDCYTTKSGREVDIEFYVERGNAAHCAHAIASLKQAMAWDETTYGLEYDLDSYMVVAVSSFNMGAMENKGLNIFNDRYVLVSPQTATDTDYELVTAVIGHEYFHNWTGNRVTCRDWFQLSLKEGLTVFREQQFMQDSVGGSTQRIEQVRMLRERQFAEDAGPLAHPVRPDSYIEINNFYTATVYEKGAELVRMLQRLLGQACFAQGLRQYLEVNNGRAATIEDFVAAMQSQTELDLQTFMPWYGQAGTPCLTVEDAYDSNSGDYCLRISQHTAPTPGQPDKQPLLIPIDFSLLDAQGQELTQRQILLSSAATEIPLQAGGGRPTAVVLKGFSAPVTLRADYEASQLSLIALHEADGFARWQALQEFFTRFLQAGIADTDALINTCATLLDKETDAGLLAELLTLPSETQLLDTAAAPVDIDQLLARRDRLQQQLAKQLGDRFLKLFTRHAETAARPYATQYAASRRLRALCLHYLLQAPDAQRRTLALQTYQQAVNLTEQLSALQALRDVDCAERDSIMQDFRKRNDSQTLVLDKWFALQATSRLGNTAPRIEQLMQDPWFDLRNPNRVRALIGAFAMRNPRGLHAADGSGYALFERLLGELDAINPQVTARLAQTLSGWRRLDPARQQQIAALLDRQLARSTISTDLFEILDKIRTVTELTS